MTVLRVLSAAVPAEDHAESWALFDAAGACVGSGRHPPAAWPRADRIEVVLAAALSRIAVVALPPMPASRVASAARFALEDQLAGPADAHHMAASAQSPDGRVRIAIASRPLLSSIAEDVPRVARIVAESDLAAPSADWRWCAREAGTAGFVRRPDGSTFPVDAPSPTGALPTELQLALAQSRRGGTTVPRVRVDAPVAEPALARWSRENSVEFVRGTPWRWESASPAAFAGAIDLLPASSHASVPAPAARAGRLFAPALAIAGIALALHVLASAAEWASLRWDALRAANAWTSLATTAGIAPEAAASPVAARQALARRYAEFRHDRGMLAPDDALPLLARAAPALATLPAGAVKSATYADGHWTLDLALADASVVANIDARMRAAGVPVLTAPSPSGTRMRFGGS
jgi:general secretion pathway protein L